MPLPELLEYNQAIQDPRICFRDPDLRGARPRVDAFDQPQPCTGNFAAVYEMRSPGANEAWAVKCFLRGVGGLKQRYRAISDHLSQAKQSGFRFGVDFQFLDDGILVNGKWHPVLKMRWVEGTNLNQFVKDNAHRPALLDALANLWQRVARELRTAQIAHGDLQHGNVLLVPGNKANTVNLRLIDYDGMYVPALSRQKSEEIGHRNFQHPQRIADSYHGEIDRFSHLVISTALRCVMATGRTLWDRYDSGENLLFREEDYQSPGSSQLFQEVWKSGEPTAHALVGRLALACLGSARDVPLLDEIALEGRPVPLTADEERRVVTLLTVGAKKGVRPPPVAVVLPKTHVARKAAPAAGRRAVAKTPAWSGRSASSAWFQAAQAASLAPALPSRLRRKKPRWPSSLPLAGAAVAVVTVAALLIFVATRASTRPDIADVSAPANVAPPSVGEPKAVRPPSPGASTIKGDNAALPTPSEQTPSEPPENHPPTLEIVDIEPQTLEAGGSLTIILRYNDPEGGVLTMEYGTDLDDNWHTTSGDLVTIPNLAAGSYTVFVKATDPAGNFDVASRRVDVKPRLAIAPFSAEQAIKHQTAWAKHFNCPAVETNSIGMKLGLIPPGEFQMGSPMSEPGRQDDELQHTVRITKPFYIGVCEVTQKQCRNIIGNNPSWFSPGSGGKDQVRNLDTSQFPVENTSWDDAVAFCKQLSALPAEQSAGRVYRLPTEGEWEWACRAGTTTPFYFGSQCDARAANCNAQLPTNVVGPFLNRPTTVGSYMPNPFGLRDMHGNVWEWCWDYFGRYSPEAQTNPNGPPTGARRMRRGGCYGNNASNCRSAHRWSDEVRFRHESIGFRVVMTATNGDPARAATIEPPVSSSPPKPDAVASPVTNAQPALARAPFSADDAKRHRAEWANHLKTDVVVINSIGMKLVLIPPGEFLMGSPISEVGREQNELQHRVRITKPFYLGVCEVTQKEYQAVMGKNPSVFSPAYFAKAARAKIKVRRVDARQFPQFPVESVTWDKANEFCRKLSARAAEQSAGRVYRLPTEAEWEYACRAGTTTPFHFGGQCNGAEANCNGQGPYGTNVKGLNLGRPAVVGSYAPNPFDLRDMHGNVWEWCSDWYGAYDESVDNAANPIGAATGSMRVLRGGGWTAGTAYCRAADRDAHPPSYPTDSLGFRVVLVPSSRTSEAAGAGRARP